LHKTESTKTVKQFRGKRLLLDKVGFEQSCFALRVNKKGKFKTTLWNPYKHWATEHAFKMLEQLRVESCTFKEVQKR